MSYTRRQFVEAAFEEMGMAAYTFDITPQMMESASRRLDAMMATWNARGIRIGFPLPLSPQDTDLDTETGVPDAANEAIITNLAIRIAPSFGKQVSPMTMATAKTAYDALQARFSTVYEMQFPRNMPAGAGNKPWRYNNPFLLPPADPIAVGPDGYLEIY
jgi:hypothetical protein